MSRRGLGARIRKTITGGHQRRARQREDRRHSRGAAELSLVVVAGSLVAGVFFGNGISDTAVDVADGLTWLSDDPSGEVMQVNPATGGLEVRQLVGAPGDDIGVVQYDGQMYVINHTTGMLMSFDLANILVSGQRRVASGGVVDTLVGDDRAFLVDGSQGTISAIDPVSTEALGTIWVAPAGLADATIDGDGTVWALETDGTLHQLEWSDDHLAFDDTDKRVIDLSGPQSVLVAHDVGVTVFGADQGIVEQAGTGADFAADATMIRGDVFAPERSPSTLVPVAVPDTHTVVIVTPEGVREVDMDSVACAEPGTPEVFRDSVYVPCRGAGKVVRLTGEGLSAEEISTPGADDPELVLDDDNLVINTPGAPQGRVVHADGTVSAIDRSDETIPVDDAADGPELGDLTDPIDNLLDDLFGDDEQEEENQPEPSDPPADDASPGHPWDNDNDDDGPGQGPGDGPGKDDPGAGEDCEESGSNPAAKKGDGKGGRHGDREECDDEPYEGADPIHAPTGVYASAQPEGQVKISWSHTGDPKPDEFVVRDTKGTEYARVKSWVREIIVSVTPGQSLSFTVSAVLGEAEATSMATAPITTTARPGAPVVSGTAEYDGDSRYERFRVTITWEEAAANGSPITGYDVTVNGADGTDTEHVSSTARSAEFEWTCDQDADPSCRVGGAFTATVVAVNALGQGEPGVVQGTKVPAQPDPPLPPGNVQLVDSSSPKTAQADMEGNGSITLKLKSNADWQRFPGSCAVLLDGNPTEQACNTRTVVVPFSNGVAYEPQSGEFRHTVTFTATNANGTSTSSSYTFTTTQPVLPPPVVEDPSNPCPNPSPTTCQIP